MKKIVISLILCIGVLGFSYAQIKPSFGFKAGLNFPRFSEDVSGDDATGFHAGAIIHVPIKKYGVMAEALYSKEGSDDIDLSYINVPIMLTYKIVPGLRAHVGPQFKINVNAKVDFDGVDADLEESFEDDIKDLNFDGVLGLEYKLPVIGIFAQARYVFGLSDVGDDFETKQNGVQLSVGYRF